MQAEPVLGNLQYMGPAHILHSISDCPHIMWCVAVSWQVVGVIIWLQVMSGIAGGEIIESWDCLCGPNQLGNSMINVLEWLNMDVRPTFWDCEEEVQYHCGGHNGCCCGGYLAKCRADSTPCGWFQLTPLSYHCPEQQGQTRCHDCMYRKSASSKWLHVSNRVQSSGGGLSHSNGGWFLGRSSAAWLHGDPVL